MATGQGNFLRRFVERHFRRKGNLEEGLRGLNSHIGLTGVRQQHRSTVDETVKTPSQELARAIFYAPDMDGQADPGEVVWVDIHTHRGETLEQRAVLIIGRKHHTLLTLLISSNAEHSEHDNWLQVGSGPWDTQGPGNTESWIRLDKVLQVPESLIQRRGVIMPERRYERIANQLRSRYGWY